MRVDNLKEGGGCSSFPWEFQLNETVQTPMNINRCASLEVPVKNRPCRLIRWMHMQCTRCVVTNSLVGRHDLNVARSHYFDFLPSLRSLVEYFSHGWSKNTYAFNTYMALPWKKRLNDAQYYELFPPTIMHLNRRKVLPVNIATDNHIP